MRTSLVAGLIFANTKDNMLKKLTSNRSMASVPFGARYRIIDFALSNLVNAGVTSVGIITRENYRSLMDHVGNGISWDLDRKNGGLYILPPYSSRDVKKYTDTVDALYHAMDYLKRCGSEYIALCDSYVLANIDISAAVKSHIENGADITILYHKGKLPEASGKKLVLTMADGNRITKITNTDVEGEAVYSIGVSIISRELLIKIICKAYEDEIKNYEKDVIPKCLKDLKVCGFEHGGFVAVLDNTHTYYQSSMSLLNREVRGDLFNKDRPILTKTRDDMPTKYAIGSKVNNSLVADGCIIEGTVKNSILFRGVKVAKGAVVENCILMQDTDVSAKAVLNNVITDKQAVISEGVVLKGTEDHHCFVGKSQIV